ncbi:MAG: dihydroorotate dehydrogenase [Candidatus Omnitrophica bacterium]|nr:dihydroorotate dehydrogenase [Candidatus Omnitrophota bacterium]
MDLKVTIGKTTFENPVWAASGTFGNGDEFQDFLNIGEMGAVVTKTVTLRKKKGNPPPRLVETPSGLLNSIGLENKGIRCFKKEDLPWLKRSGTRAIVSIAGETKEEFVKCAEELTGRHRPDAIELNISCPNVSHRGGKHCLFSQDPVITERIVSAVRRSTGTTLIVKLSPNVTDIGIIAEAAQNGGADAVSLVNTYFGMAVDAEEMRPCLGNVTGGLSGPAIRPMALKAVRDAYNSVSIPVIGVGGIMTGTDVAGFMLCGASAVQAGTVNLVEPAAYKRILREFIAYLKRKKINRAGDLVGKLRI